MSSDRQSSDTDSDAPEEFTAQQGFQQFEEITEAHKQSKARVAREGKERRRKFAENLTPRPRSQKEDESIEDVVESQAKEVQDKRGMLPDDIVKLIAAQEKKKVFSSDSEEDGETRKKLRSRKKQKKFGDGPIILKEIPHAQCLQSSLEFLKKRKMQVPRSSAALKNSKQASRLLSSKGLLSRK